MFRNNKLAGLVAVAAAALGAVATTAPAMAADSPAGATVAGGKVYAGGHYDKGVHDWGTVTDTVVDGACVHADVKLALSIYTDSVWQEARACGAGASASWNTFHWGPVISAFSMSAVQGVYVRVCRERNNLPDVCGGWAYVGR